MLGLTLNIWTDVKGISKNSGVSANPPSVSSVVTAKSTFGFHANYYQCLYPSTSQTEQHQQNNQLPEQYLLQQRAK